MGKKESLLTTDIKSLFFKYLIPSVSGMLGSSLYVLGDTMIVGRALGAQGLAALNISIPIINVFTGLGLLFGVGGATALSVSRGQGKKEDINSFFNVSLLLSLLAGIVLTLIRVFFLDDFVKMMGGTDYTFSMAKDYLGVVMSFSIAFLLNTTLSVFVRNDGSPNIAMAGMLIGSIVNVILDYILIVPMNMGMWGGALATGLSPVLGLLILSIHFIKKKNDIFFERVKIKFATIKRIIQNGFASFIVELSVGLSIFAFNLVILDIVGDIGVSAYSIIANLSLICTEIFAGVGQTIQPIISINHGAKKDKRVEKTVSLGNKTGFLLGGGFFLLALIFPKQLASIFTTERGKLMDITIRGIRIYFSAFLFTGINVVMTSYIQSMEYVRISTTISLLRGFVFLIGGLLILPRIFGLDGVWLTLPIAELLTLLVSYSIFKDYRIALKNTFIA